MYVYIPCTLSPVLDLSPRTSGFNLRSVHVGFEWTKLTQGPDFLRILQVGSTSFFFTCPILTYLSSTKEAM
jgi:hypothetical protein